MWHFTADSFYQASILLLKNKQISVWKQPFSHYIEGNLWSMRKVTSTFSPTGAVADANTSTKTNNKTNNNNNNKY